MPNETPFSPPQVGADATESQKLVEEIRNTGVIQSQDAAENVPAHDENMSDGDEPPQIPMPIITRS